MKSESTLQQLTCAVKANPNVIFRRLGDEIVLFDLDTDRFYELNSTAARFWELLAGQKDAEGVHERMLAEFAVDSEQLAAEAQAFLTVLRQQGLVRDDD
jgi:hypothetical protein